MDSIFIEYLDRIIRIEMIYFLAFRKKARTHNLPPAEVLYNYDFKSPSLQASSHPSFIANGAFSFEL
jgi:hypothetical protein